MNAAGGGWACSVGARVFCVCLGVSPEVVVVWTRSSVDGQVCNKAWGFGGGGGVTSGYFHDC
jgi:hypothetical protein